MLELILMLVIGLVTGLATGLTGASGVVIVVPLLTMLLGFSIYEAIGTSLVVDVVASLAITFAYLKHGNVERSGIWIALGSIAGAQVGALIATQLPEGGLSVGFGLSMIFMGLFMWSRGEKQIGPANGEHDAVIKHSVGQILKAIVLGFGIGLVTGIVGAGGGIMILLVLILVLKFPLHKAIGTSTLIMAVTALSGAVGYGLQGQISLVGGLVVGLGSVVGGVASARIANTFSERALARTGASVFVILGVVMTVLQYSGATLAHG